MGDSVTFKYVYIPWSVTEPVEERSMTVPKDKELECLLNEMKAHFKKTSPQESVEQRTMRSKAMLANMGVKEVPEGMLDTVMDMTMVENIALLSNAPATSFVAVNMYCDDHASLKQLPSNPRASDLAYNCGKALDVKGDVFIGRIFDNEDDFKRLDFSMSDLSSSAPWVGEAKQQAQRNRDRGDVSTQWQFLQQNRQQQQPSASTTTQVVELTPAESQKEAGNAAFKAGKWVEAVEHYTAAIKLDSTLTSALNNRAMAYLKLSRLQEAAADCSAVLALEPTNVKALLRRATAQEGLDQPNEALRDAEAVLALQPLNKEAAALKAKLEAAGAASQSAEEVQPAAAATSAAMEV